MPKGSDRARLAAPADAVPDEIWDEAARHHDQRGLAALLLWIALTNVWNRLNVSTRQAASAWATSTDGKAWAKTSGSA